MNGQFIQGIRIEWNLIGAKSYLRNIEALNSLQELMFKKPVTFFVGENGSGKSTLLEAIAVSAGFNPEGGRMSCAVQCEIYNRMMRKGIM